MAEELNIELWLYAVVSLNYEILNTKRENQKICEIWDVPSQGAGWITLMPVEEDIEDKNKKDEKIRTEKSEQQ